jgi:hypothetical protein
VAFSDVISAWILDGAQWKAFPTNPLGGDSAESSVGVAATPDGIVVGWLPFDGNKVTAQVSRLATKTGTWTDLPSPEEHVANNPHLSLAASTSGAIFWTLGADVQRLAATGSAWQSLGDGELPMCPDSYGLCKKLLTGGLEDRVTQLKDPNALLLQRHDGTQWQPLGAGLGERHRLDAAATSPDGTIFVLWHPLAENGADAELPMQVTQIKPS